MALFLIVAGLTGSVLAFLGELEVALNPEYAVAQPAGAIFDPLAVREQVAARLPQARIDGIPLHHKAGEALHLWIEMPGATSNDEWVTTALVINPYSGAAISRRTTELWPITRKNFMALVYRIHYSLVLGDFGLWLFGIAALVWTFDCFVGIYLTFPKRSASHVFPRQTVPRSWWSRWMVAWKLKWRSSPRRFNFDLHRVLGLWPWMLLLVFGWSGVCFNLYDQVYKPVMHATFGMEDPIASQPKREQGTVASAMNWRNALATGQRLMDEQARIHGIRIQREELLSYDRERHLFRYDVLSDRDVSERWGSTSVAFDATSGDFVALSLPTGQTSGRTITNWIATIHTASLWGLPMQLLVSAVGLAVAVLSVTGVRIWLQKRRSVRAASETH